MSPGFLLPAAGKGTGRVWVLNWGLPPAWVTPAPFPSSGARPSPALPPSVLVSPLLALWVSVPASLPLHVQ